MATVRYDDGSVASLLYTALGASDLSKEYVEIYADSKVMMIDDYRALRVYGVRVKAWKSQAQDKGQRGESGVRSWPSVSIVKRGTLTGVFNPETTGYAPQ